MSHPIAAKITGVAGYVPPKVMTNADLEKIVETMTNGSARARHPRTPHRGEWRGHLAHGHGSRKGRAGANQDRSSEIDLIVLASVTPDMFFPATACLVQERIGAKKAWGFDLSAACSGFAYALTVGAQFVGAGTHKKVSSDRQRYDDVRSRL